MYKSMKQAMATKVIGNWAEYFLQQGNTLKSTNDEGQNKLEIYQQNERWNVNGWTKRDMVYAVKVAAGDAPDLAKYKELVPNLSYGPLSLAQKVYIRDNLHDVKPRDLALYVQSSPQNVQAAQQGLFQEAAPAPVVDRNTDKPYGPLSYEDKVYIRDNHATDNAMALAAKFNTHYNNILRAQKGQFTEPASVRQARLSNRPYGPLTLDEKRFIRDNRSDEDTRDLALEYNTLYNNVKLAQEGRFKDLRPAGLTALQKVELLRDALQKARGVIDGSEDYSIVDIDSVLEECS